MSNKKEEMYSGREKKKKKTGAQRNKEGEKEREKLKVEVEKAKKKKKKGKISMDPCCVCHNLSPKCHRGLPKPQIQ